ncbi:MAG: aryl-alcohol dehydrogenase-like predicted oxidoreductase [Gammaproteobacteria bacterium]|jgi:aryl-alcohol dehydrogenase-like predicted oxidoreductase
MDRRYIGGPNGLKVGLVGLGCNAFGGRVDEKGTHAVVDAAIEAGIDFFDTAETYGGGKSELFMGSGLKGKREKIFLASKFGYSTSHVAGKNRGAPENIRFAIEQSLSKLQTDWIDLYQLHRPDADTPVEETMGALEDLVAEGKIRYYGCSYFSGAQMRQAAGAAQRAGLRGFVTAQNAWNMLEREIEADLIPVCKANEIGVLPYYPIAKGLLTGKYRRDDAAPAGSRLSGDQYLADANFDLLERLQNYAREHGHELLTLAMSWLAAQPSIACIISGASRPEQVAANAGAVRWNLTSTQLAEIDAMLAA